MKANTAVGQTGEAQGKGPEGGGLKCGSLKGGGPEGWEAQNFAFFFFPFSRHSFFLPSLGGVFSCLFFPLLGGSSRGILVSEAPGP